MSARIFLLFLYIATAVVPASADAQKPLRPSADSLRIAAMAVGYAYVLKNPLQPATRENVEIVPAPGGFFLRSQPFILYYEVENLAVRSGSRYIVEYSLTPLSFGIIPESRNLNAALPGESPASTRLSFPVIKARSDDYAVLTVEHRIAEPGQYRLTLYITDLHAEKSVSRSVLLWFF